MATYGPALLGAGALLLVVGTLGVLFFVLAPARRRLGSLERAASALGAGDTTARAPEGGGDDIAALVGGVQPDGRRARGAARRTAAGRSRAPSTAGRRCRTS